MNGSSKYLKVAEEHGIQIVPFEFLEECEKPGANGILNINKMNLATWSSDVIVFLHFKMCTRFIIFNLNFHPQPTNRMNFDVVDTKSKSKSLSFSGKISSAVIIIKFNRLVIRYVLYFFRWQIQVESSFQSET